MPCGAFFVQAYCSYPSSNPDKSTKCSQLDPRLVMHRPQASLCKAPRCSAHAPYRHTCKHDYTCLHSGTPLAPPLTDSNKPKIPSGPDLRPPPIPWSTPDPLGATPQLAKSTPSLPSGPDAAEKAGSQVNIHLYVSPCLIPDLVQT